MFELDYFDGGDCLLAIVYAGASESTWSCGLCDDHEHGEIQISDVRIEGFGANWA